MVNANTGDGTNTLAVVPAPPAEPPVTGLIASLGPAGGPYLDPPDVFDPWQMPALNTRGATMARTREAIVAVGLHPLLALLDGCGVDLESVDGPLASLVANRPDEAPALLDEVLGKALAAGAYNPPTIGLPGWGRDPDVADSAVSLADPRTGVGPLRARWEDGFRYLPELVCWPATTAQDPCSPDLSTTPAQPSTVAAQPSLVWAGDKCSAFGWQAHDYRGRAIRGLLALESKMIAAEFWKGTRAVASSWPNRYLSSILSDTVTAGPVSPATALDVLEQALAECSNGQRGAIHCTPQLGSFWSGLGGTVRSLNGIIQTYRGTLIIADAGYDGSGPGGVARTDGSQWAYATLVPQVRRSAVHLTPDSYAGALDRSLNTVTWVAWRVAAATFPTCCHLAAEVNLPLPLVGGAS